MDADDGADGPVEPRVVAMTGFGAPELLGTDRSRNFAAAGRALVEVDPASCSDDGRLGVLGDLERAQRSLDAVRVRFTAAVAASGVTDERFGHRTSRWWATRHGGPVGHPRRDLRTARVLTGHHPAIQQALRDGELPLVRAEAIVRATTWTDLHHVVRVADGGETTLDNLASLCR